MIRYVDHKLPNSASNFVLREARWKKVQCHNKCRVISNVREVECYSSGIAMVAFCGADDAIECIARLIFVVKEAQDIRVGGKVLFEYLHYLAVNVDIFSVQFLFQP